MYLRSTSFVSETTFRKRDRVDHYPMFYESINHLRLIIRFASYTTCRKMPDIVIVSGIASRSQNEDARSGLRRFVASRFPGHLVHFFDLLGTEDTHRTNDQVISLKARELLAFLLGIRSSQGQNVPANETASATGMV